jgi:hypothetical protein
MDRRRKVELFEQIRREYRFGVGTIRGVAKQFGVLRRDLRPSFYIAGAEGGTQTGLHPWAETRN